MMSNQSIYNYAGVKSAHTGFEDRQFQDEDYESDFSQDEFDEQDYSDSYDYDCENDEYVDKRDLEADKAYIEELKREEEAKFDYEIAEMEKKKIEDEKRFC